MKKIFQYMAAFLLILIVGSGCEDNSNWTIVTDVQPGTYVTGDALIYSAVASSASLKAADLDGAPDGTKVTGIYTWIKASGSFTILKVDDEGNEVSYGKGSVVETSPYETVSLQADGPAFTVPADGLYYVVTNNADGQVTIIPAQFGIIGDATAGAWDSETVMTQSFDENQALVEMKLNAELDKKSMKFRYHDWGIEIPYEGGKVKFHSNVGATAAGDITAAFSECKGGGDNFSVAQKNMYDITLQLDLRTGVFKAKIVATGEAPEEPDTPEMPENMFMIGSAVGGWSWGDGDGVAMINVTGTDGMFWAIRYFDANQELKFSPVRDWAGDFGFSGANLPAASISLAGLSENDGNIKIGNAGWYIVTVTTSTTDGTYTVEFLEPDVWLVGTAASGGWSPGSDPLDKFAVPVDGTGDFISPAFVDNTNELRMCVLLPGVNDWWRAEFMVLSGVIEFRGNGGDQDRVTGTAGQNVILNFGTGTGSIQ